MRILHGRNATRTAVAEDVVFALESASRWAATDNSSGILWALLGPSSAAGSRVLFKIDAGTDDACLKEFAACDLAWGNWGSAPYTAGRE